MIKINDQNCLECLIWQLFSKYLTKDRFSGMEFTNGEVE